MRKVILTPEEMAGLKTHWPELDPAKLGRLGAISTRGTRFKNNGDRGAVVMSSPAILVSSDGVILNGKHRACEGVAKGLSSEACIIDNVGDIVYHTPQAYLGDMTREEVASLFEKRDSYVRHSESSGAGTVGELVEKYALTG